MVKFLISVIILLLGTYSVQSVMAEVWKADNEFARITNKFAHETLTLHKNLIKEKEVKVEKSIGGYQGMPEFYQQEKYIDQGSGNVISVVTWERENPELLHTIEVFIYDDKGRVIRDYAAAYLPTYRHAPTQTLVSLHKYNGKLHAFRTFDAVGDRVVDRCEGTYKGKKINLLLDEDEIYEALHGSSTAMELADYKVCFNGLTDKPGRFLMPQ